MNITVTAGQVLLYELGSLIPRIEVTQEGATLEDDLQARTGTLVVQCLPIECIVDIPALGIERIRKTQDRLIARSVPQGTYEGRITSGATTLPTTFQVCGDDTTTVFGTFLASNQGVSVTSAAGLGADCNAVSVRIDPPITGVLLGDTIALRAIITGMNEDDLLWTATAGRLEGSGVDVTFTAPDTAGEVLVRATNGTDPTVFDERLLSIAAVVIERFDVPTTATEGDEITITWQLTTSETIASNVTCVLEISGLPDRPLGDCANATTTIALTNPGTTHLTLRIESDSEVIAVARETIDVRAMPQTIAAGTRHSLAVREDGTVYAWGGNNLGQLGDGSTTNRSTPVQVLRNVRAVTAGSAHSLAVREDGTLWSWGHNEFGQLGDGTTNGRRTPAVLEGFSLW